ncbi:MAG TPA: 4-hydroxybenzoate octaprenyltransferase [Dongiaceae bacterium]|jgi:4-hydroxybenzoate polyprenyltransferase|nr:4-hydroxybenzoate octaprenyltransferase [Dongiaceae bacterium]
MASANPSSSFTDIRRGDWVDRLVPAPLRPYFRLARLDRPIGTWLLLFPCWWSIALAAPPGGGPNIRLLVLFALGALVMRGAGCTINDMADRDFDRRVTRTASRPMASGAVSMRGALVFLALQLLIGLVILLQLSPLAIALGVASLALIVTYPFMKRVTYWPQAFLGLTFNWGALMGYAAAKDRLDAAPLLLYAAGIAWTLVYDTIYAHQDKEDDALIGIRSTALKFGAATRRWLVPFAIVMTLLLAAMIAAAGLGLFAWLALIGVAGHLAWQIATVDFDNPADCLAKFHSNRKLGWILLIGIILGRLA